MEGEGSAIIYRNRELEEKPKLEGEELVAQSFPSLRKIKAALPAHCFESDLVRSLSYLVRDMSIIVALFVAANQLCERFAIFWPLYWFLQGTMFWAVFVLGHDCGHGSFSRYPWFNDFLGTILHTAILVPYYSWKLSHRAHHKNTGNIDRDEIFYPVKRKELCGSTQGPLSVPIFNKLYFGLGLGWFLYLFLGYRPRNVYHFDPNDSLYAGQSRKISITLIAYAIMLAFVGAYTFTFGLSSMFCYYGVPILVFASWLVIVTFLHHNDLHVPWYTNSNWTYVKGNLSSVDRSYGFLHNIIHNIGTHQVHHLFPAVPHYHLEEATEAFDYAFPDLVKRNDKPIIPAFISMFKVFSDNSVIDDDVELFEYTDEGN